MLTLVISNSKSTFRVSQASLEIQIQIVVSWNNDPLVAFEVASESCRRLAFRRIPISDQDVIPILIQIKIVDLKFHPLPHELSEALCYCILPTWWSFQVVQKLCTGIPGLLDIALDSRARSELGLAELLLTFHHRFEVLFSMTHWWTIQILVSSESDRINDYKTYRKPFLSTEASVLNFIIMKLEADTNDLLVKSCLPDMVARLTEVSSVLPPTRIWTVSKLFSVSNSWNYKQNCHIKIEIVINGSR